MNKPDVSPKFREVKLLALDVDGVLTDGGIFVGEDGMQMRRFNVKDGIALKQLLAVGIPVVIISSSDCQAVAFRARQLGIQEVYLGVPDKLSILEQVCGRYGVALNQVCYIGDDLPDIPVLAHVGCPCAPADAVQAVKALPLYLTSLAGGMGAVREICDLILDAQK